MLAIILLIYFSNFILGIVKYILILEKKCKLLLFFFNFFIIYILIKKNFKIMKKQLGGGTIQKQGIFRIFLL